MERDTGQMDLSDFCKRGALEKRPLVSLLAGSLHFYSSWPVYIESEPCLEWVLAGVWRGFSVDDLRRVSALELLMRQAGRRVRRGTETWRRQLLSLTQSFEV